MRLKLLLTGDVNLMNVSDPAVPFRRVAPAFRAADIVFSNLECCLYDPPSGHTHESEGFYAPAATGGDALRLAGIEVVGIANNVNYGEAAITASIARLDQLGIRHTGAGANRAAAGAPVVVERNGLRVGFLQRTSVYWPTNHEAGENATGVAVIRGHTAYQLPLHKVRPDLPACNRPGLPPIVVTWADPQYLQRFRDDISALRANTDLVVASCHWGLQRDVLQYMTDIAHAAIDAGADVVIGHGPHYSLPIEVYRGKPVFYGLGSFSFHTGHGGNKHGDWIGMLARVGMKGSVLDSASFQFVRHNDDNETVVCKLDNERATLDDLMGRSAACDAGLVARGNEVSIELP